MLSRLYDLSNFLAALAARFFVLPRGKRRRLAKRAIRCWFERLEAREVFNVTYNGGALIPHVEAQAVFLGSQWTSNSTLQTEAAAIDNMLAYTVQSPYMDLLTDAGYNVGQGTATTGARISVSLTATTTDATIRSLLQQAITLKLVQQPDANRLYLVYTPSGIAINNNGATSQVSFLGYHGAFAGTDSSGVPFDIHYVVVPHPGTPNPTSASQGFTGATEVQTLTLGGGTAAGSLTPAFNGAFATTSIFRRNEVQKLTISGVNDTIHLSFNGVAGSDATQLSFVSGVSPNAADITTHLNTIPALNGNVNVTGSAGGPFTITFMGALANVNSSTLVASVAGSATATVTTVTDGSLPTAADVLASLNSIPSTPSLSGNVTVTGNAGGPFTITIRNLGNVAPIDVSGVAGGMTASITTAADGFAGITSDLDQLTSVTAHELAEAITDPDVNYKTLGWYDLTNNVEIGDLASSVLDVPNNNVRLGPSGYFVQDIFSQLNKVIAADTTSINFVAPLSDVRVTQISSTQAVVSWTPVDHGATGYRVYLVNGSSQTLLSRVPRTATSTVVSLPALSDVTLKVEAYNASHVTDPVTVSFTMDLPAVQKPVITSVKAISPTSAQINWTSTVPADSTQVLTLGGSGEGTFKLAYNGSAATAALTRTDEVQTLTVGGADGGTVQLSYKGVAGSTATQLKIIAGSSPAAADVLNHLTSIAELSTPGVLQVVGPAGGPFTIKFTGGLSGVNVDQLTVTTAGGATASVATTTVGAAPTSADVQTALTTAVPGLAGHITVSGNSGGPYFFDFNNISPVALVNVDSVTGGLTANVSGDVGAAGFRIFSVISGKKTLVATLPGSASTATISGLPTGKPVSFIVEAFRGSTTVDSAAKTVQPTPLSKPSVSLTQLTPTVARLDWATVPSAKGYRVYRLTSTGRRVLISSLKASATSIKISGYPAGTRFFVQAFSGSQTADSNIVP